jgi:hypothetical protein
LLLIRTDRHGHTLGVFSHIAAATVSTEKAYLCVSSNEGVLCMTLDGVCKFKYKHADLHVGGVDFDDEGKVLFGGQT